METINSLAQIDAKLREIDKAWAVSQLAVREVFSSFAMNFDEFYRDIPKDPFSAEYFDYQMKLYDRLAGKKYEVTNEVTPVDVGPAVTCPFPYNSKSNELAGAHISLLGFVIGGMKLAPGSKVIEFGAGWGNSTITLALLGHRVTVVEIEPRFCDLIRQRAKLHGVSIDVVNSDFFSCESMSGEFDAALFYECFHHCSDHMRLLRGLHKVVKPSGTVYLGSEPITPEFPVPWGLRLDGESLWAIRQNGWLELGYREDYFREALRRTGWFPASVRRARDCDSSLWTLKQMVDGRLEIGAGDAAVCSPVTERVGGRLVLDGSQREGHVLWGPYVDLGAGRWEAQIRLVEKSGRGGRIRADVCTEGGTKIVSERELDLGTLAGDVISVPFTLAEGASRIEARIYARTPVTLSIAAIVFQPLDSQPPSSSWETRRPAVPASRRSWRNLTKRALLKMARLVDRTE